MMVSVRSLLVAVVDQPDGQVPHQFLFLKVGVLIQAIEALSFKLVPIGQFEVLQQVPVHLHTLESLQGVGVEVVEVVIGIAGSLAGEEEAVVADLRVEGFVDGEPV
jgi:endonuclease III